MREIPPPSPAIVVGIDGSRGAVDTALWAIDEAVERDLPLRLVYAIADRDRGPIDAQNIAHDFATGEAAVRYAAMAIESIDKPVKIEVEIVQGRPATALLSASRDAAMLCIGALGVDRATGKRVGSTVTELLARAHCPVAIIRPDRLKTREPGWVVTEFEESPDGSTVLGLALDEARMRHAPLRVLATWRPHFTDIYDDHAHTEGARQAEANLERSLTRYRRLYPDLDIKAVATQGSPLNYLTRHADSIQLIVLGHQPSAELAEFAGPAPRAARHGINCSVLISGRHGAL
jgi:nucleotide-binding universal stress UspA family protein